MPKSFCFQEMASREMSKSVLRSVESFRSSLSRDDGTESPVSLQKINLIFLLLFLKSAGIWIHLTC